MVIARPTAALAWVCVLGCGEVGESREAIETTNPAAQELTAFTRELYELVSGPAGERDWEAIRDRFIPGATLHGLTRRGDTALPEARVQSLDQWIEGARVYFAAAPLYERELEAQVIQQGVLAHVFSTYESRSDPDSMPFQSGINSLVLVATPGGWRIATWLSVETSTPAQ